MYFFFFPSLLYGEVIRKSEIISIPTQRSGCKRSAHKTFLMPVNLTDHEAKINYSFRSLTRCQDGRISQVKLYPIFSVNQIMEKL